MAKPKLRLALVAPLIAPIAPPFVGGAQVMLSELAQGLAAREHHVTLYASEGSKLSEPNLELVPIKADQAMLSLADFNVKDKGVAGAQADNVFFGQANLFLQVFLQIATRQKDFDIVHAHAFDWPAFAFGTLAPLPVVHTMHLPAVDAHINSLLATAYTQIGTSNCVTVSHACAATYASYFQFDKIIYNGIKIEDIPFSDKAHDFLIFVGRMSPEKGADLAIEIARRVGKKLVLAGGIYDRTFFEQKIAPQLAADPNLEYRGHLDRSALFQLIGQAHAALFPVRWDEPFGLALAEVQAAGTPVVAFRRGAFPEIVLEGETGFLIEPGANEIEAAIAALHKIGQINRAKCRENIANRFSYAQMLDAYENYYLAKIGQH